MQQSRFKLYGAAGEWYGACIGAVLMAEDTPERGGLSTMKATLWASAGLIVGAFYLGYYCAKFFFLP